MGTYANPGVLERLVRTDSFRGIHRQHLVDEIFGLWGHSIPLRGRVLKKNGFFFREKMFVFLEKMVSFLTKFVSTSPNFQLVLKVLVLCELF